jgi:hypothetical protein
LLVGWNSSIRSTSLSGFISPRAADPKTESFFTPYLRHSAAISFFGMRSLAA